MLERAPKFFQSYYVNTLHRCPSYLVGIMLGWILNKTKNSNFKIEKVCFSVINYSDTKKTFYVKHGVKKLR